MLTHLPGGHEHEASSGSGGITTPGSLCAFIWTMRFIPSHWIPVVLISGKSFKLLFPEEGVTLEKCETG